MLTVERAVYYCEFCKRHRLSAAAIVKHEPRCIYNPDRSACGWHRDRAVTRPADLVEAFRETRDLAWLHDETDGCPACQLAVVVQARKLGEEGYYDEFVGTAPRGGPVVNDRIPPNSPQGTVAASDREPAPDWIPYATDEKPSDAMPQAGFEDWREQAKWWQDNAVYWRGIAQDAQHGRELARLDTERERIEAERYRAALERIYQQGRGPHVPIAREALDAS